MAVTTLDERTALVLIDLQTGVATAATQPHTAGEVIARSAELAAALPTWTCSCAAGAMADRSAEAHRASIAAIFPRIGETGTTGEVLELLKS